MITRVNGSAYSCIGSTTRCNTSNSRYFLLLRSSPILSYSSDALLVITLVGSITAFVAGTTALVQNDLKRIIAFSTISQLGYMMIAIGLAQ